jgi:hypothetical protein
MQWECGTLVTNRSCQQILTKKMGHHDVRRRPFPAPNDEVRNDYLITEPSTLLSDLFDNLRGNGGDNRNGIDSDRFSEARSPLRLKSIELPASGTRQGASGAPNGRDIRQRPATLSEPGWQACSTPYYAVLVELHLAFDSVYTENVSMFRGRISNRLHGVTAQKMAILFFVAVSHILLCSAR